MGLFFLMRLSFIDAHQEIRIKQKIEKATEFFKTLKMYSDRLDLSKRQYEKMVKVIKKSLEKRKKIRAKYDVEKISDEIRLKNDSLSKLKKRRILRSLKIEMEKVDKYVLKQVSLFLNKKQIRKIKKIKKEIQSKRKAKIRKAMKL